MMNVNYVLLAEFDIDQGSTLKHQYPPSIHTADQHLLAEHMLPDGAHDRSDDWTVFYLNQIPQMTVELPAKDDTETAGDDEDNTKLLYVLSLVRTKKVATARRGAMVKALAVATYKPYIQIYKPILLLALDAYFEDPSLECLIRLYNSINAMDTLHCPHLTFDERIILRTSERHDLFREKFDDGARNSSIGKASLAGDEDAVPSNGNGVRRQDRRSVTSNTSGSSVKRTSKDSTTIRTPTPTDDLAPFRPRAHTTESSNDGTAPSMSASPTSDRVGYHSFSLERLGRPKDSHWFETSIDYAGINLPVRIPLSTFPEEVGDYSLIKLIQTFSTPTTLSTTGPLHPHLHTNGHQTHPIILLFNALVTHKRIVFLGHGQAAGTVAHLVLAACALGSGCGSVIRGFTERAFPYTNLTNLDNLETVPGFIAGVCNPAFADRPSWWDVLCNIETGKIIISKEINLESTAARTPLHSPRQGSTFDSNSHSFLDVESDDVKNSASMNGKGDSVDNIFMDEIANSIAPHYGESIVRARITDYVHRFTRLASRYEEETTGLTTIGFPSSPFVRSTMSQSASLGSGAVFFGDEASKNREIAASIGRIEGWNVTRGYSLFQKTFERRQEISSLRHFDLVHQLARLRQGRNVSANEASLIYSTLARSIITDEQIITLLSRLPAHQGGLLSIAFGLFHPSESVRIAVVDLLNTLNAHPTGKKFIESLNAFHRSAYYRLASYSSISASSSEELFISSSVSTAVAL